MIATTHLVPHTCGECGVVFGFPNDLLEQRQSDGQRWYCPNGHCRIFNETDAVRLRRAEAQLTSTKDQLQAAKNEAEETRRTLVRERARFANGVCPCCNRSFSNVRRHMETKHPDYDTSPLLASGSLFRCTCGRSFETYRGLRSHQGHAYRPERHQTKV